MLLSQEERGEEQVEAAALVSQRECAQLRSELQAVGEQLVKARRSAEQHVERGEVAAARAVQAADSTNEQVRIIPSKM